MAGTLMSQLPGAAPVRCRTAVLRQLDREHGDQMKSTRVIAALSAAVVAGAPLCGGAAPAQAGVAPPRAGRVAARLRPRRGHGGLAAAHHPAGRASAAGRRRGRAARRHLPPAGASGRRARHRPSRRTGGSTPILSGAGLTPPSGLTALVEIADSTRGDGARARADRLPHRASSTSCRPASTSTATTRRSRSSGNHVHDLGNDNGTLGSFDINAHGIAVYGDDPHASDHRARASAATRSTTCTSAPARASSSTATSTAGRSPATASTTTTTSASTRSASSRR